MLGMSDSSSSDSDDWSFHSIRPMKSFRQGTKPNTRTSFSVRKEERCNRATIRSELSLWECTGTCVGCLQNVKSNVSHFENFIDRVFKLRKSTFDRKENQLYAHILTLFEPCERISYSIFGHFWRGSVQACVYLGTRVLECNV